MVSIPWGEVAQIQTADSCMCSWEARSRRSLESEEISSLRFPFYLLLFLLRPIRLHAKAEEGNKDRSLRLKLTLYSQLMASIDCWVSCNLPLQKMFKSQPTTRSKRSINDDWQKMEMQCACEHTADACTLMYVYPCRGTECEPGNQEEGWVVGGQVKPSCRLFSLPHHYGVRLS